MCLFVILLAVFTWAVHRRLAQYDSVLQDGHHLAATKVCLPDRPQVAIASTKTMHETAPLIVAAVYALTIVRQIDILPRYGKPEEAWLVWTRWEHPGLTHFFALPPPSRATSL